MPSVVSLDHEAISRVAKRHGVAELSLFGSAAAGTSHHNSDVDSLVDFLPDRPDPLEDFCALRDDLSRILERDVDLVVKRAIRNPYLRDSALAQAEVGYVADV